MSRSLSPREKDNIDDERKVFITNIDGTQAESAVQLELKRLFDKFGRINKLNVKKSKNGLYSFAFLEFDQAENALTAIRQMDQYEIFGKRMRVRQDKQSQGCFYCKKTGHFARQCPQNKDNKNKDINNNRSSRHQDSRENYRERKDYGDRYRNDRNRDRNQYADRRRGQYQSRRYKNYSRSRSRSLSRQHRRQNRHRNDRSRSHSGQEYKHKRQVRHYDQRRSSNRDRERQRQMPRRDFPKRRKNSSYSHSRSQSSR